MEFCQASAEVSVEETTYFGLSLKKGTPGSSSTDRVDQAGANISKVRRPSRIAELPPVSAAIAAPMPSVNPNSAVQLGFSNTPSRLTNSCTLILPMRVRPLVRGRVVRHVIGDRPPVKDAAAGRTAAAITPKRRS